MNSQEIIAIVLGSGGFTALVTWFTMRAKTREEANKIAGDVTQQIIVRMKEEIDRLVLEKEQKRKTIEEQAQQILELSKQLIEQKKVEIGYQSQITELEKKIDELREMIRQIDMKYDRNNPIK